MMRRLSRRRLDFSIVTAGYLAATTAQWIVQPLFPLLARALGLDSRAAGVVFGLLAAAAAVGGLAGGFALVRAGPRVAAVGGLALAAVGGVVCATADGLGQLLAGEIALGLGSGTYFASGVFTAGALAGDGRRGLAMGIFGVAFSAGVGLAGLLAALGEVWGWRASFAATAVVALACALTLAQRRLPDVPARRHARQPLRRRAAVTPLAVGGVTAASQYGTVAFLPLFAVEVWGLAPATAALIITASRVLSVPAKLLTGNAADREGSLRLARRLGLVLASLGACWTLFPIPAIAVGAATIFGALVTALAPIGNVLALDAFADRGHLLGVFNSVQLAVGAATTILLGMATVEFGLRAALVVTGIAIPASLLALPLISGAVDPQHSERS